jgi:hypothetical protein
MQKPTIRITALLALVIGLSGLCLAQRGAPSSDSSTRPSPTDRQRPRRYRGGVATGQAPFLGAEIKTPANNSPGAQVVSIVSDSPAQAAGLQVGDVIINLAGKSVASTDELKTVLAGLSIGADYQMTVLSASGLKVLTVRLAAPSTEPINVVPPRKGPLDINTLKYVLIDPKTREITFIGKYDPAYATGPIPYADILKDAMANPYPSFSIEPSQQQRAQFDAVDRMIGADMARMNDLNFCNQWAQKLMNLLMNDPTLSTDNKRFFRNCAEATGMTGDEWKRMYDAVQGKITIPNSETMVLVSKLMRGVGAPKAADGLMAMSTGGEPQDLIRKMSEAMGLSTQYEELSTKWSSGALSTEQFKNETIILCISVMCREFEAPESEIQSRIASIRSGQPATLLTGYMAEQMGAFILNRSGARMLNGLVLGPEVMSKMYNLPVPQSNMDFRDIPADSQLGDVLFRSDYRLKSICAYPDARDKVPAHLTSMGFLQKEQIARNYYLPGNSSADVGHRLVPADVKMRISPAGDVVEFQDSKVRILGWVRGMLGNTRGDAADFINSATPKYGDFLTEHYDEYAKVYPEWHRMSEVAKLVALARWAKKNNYSINVVNASGAKIPHSATVAGFWSAVFQVIGDQPSLTLLVEGGASFASDEGEDWIKPEPDVTVTADINKQLIASTVFAEQAVNALKSNDLDAARDLADKSARAMTGDIDLTQLPSLNGIPVPGEPAAYAAATAEVINEASECLNTMDTAQKDLARAGQLAATNPEEAAKITQQATKTQDEAQAKLQEILKTVTWYKNDPTQAGAAVVALRNPSSAVTPSGGGSSSGGTVAQGPTTIPVTPDEDWSAKKAKLIAQLDQVNKEIESTKSVLMKLSASIQADGKQFAEWETAANAGFDRCVKVAGDVVVDFGVGDFAERYDTIDKLAKKLPGDPKDVIEKYRHLSSLFNRLKEAKEATDVAGIAASEGKTDQEIWETLRDGVGQIIGDLGLDKKFPALQAWRYGQLAADMAYNLTELYHGWKNVGTLEANNVRYAEAVKKLAARMQKLIEYQRELRQKIEAGEPVDYSH